MTSRPSKIRTAFVLALTSMTLATAIVPSASAAGYPNAPYRDREESLPLNIQYFDQSRNINDFRVDQPREFRRDSRIFFTLRGASRGQASVLVQAVGISRNIRLEETSLGVYEGSYTLSNSDFDRPNFKAQLVKGRDISNAIATVDESRLDRSWRDRDNRGNRDAYRPASPPVARPLPVASNCFTCGIVESVQVVDRRSNPPQGREGNDAVGLIGGAIVGGLLGNQIGGGSGRTAATAIGAVGGGYLGQEISRGQNGNNNNPGPSERAFIVHIRMDDGSLQNLTQYEDPRIAIGERVNIENNRITVIRR